MAATKGTIGEHIKGDKGDRGDTRPPGDSIKGDEGDKGDADRGDAVFIPAVITAMLTRMMPSSYLRQSAAAHRAPWCTRGCFSAADHAACPWKGSLRLVSVRSAKLPDLVLKRSALPLAAP